MKPLILINFKTYPEASGKQALKIAQNLAAVNRSKYNVVISPSLLTIKEIAEKVKMPVYAQHIDPLAFGAHTGSIPLDELQSFGIKGTLLNHSERKLPFPILEKAIALCKKKKMTTIVCSSSLSETKKIALLKPDYLAYEPPELIGGDISVTTSEPEVISKAVELVKSISPSTKVLCGAGIQSKEDIAQALVLGTEGVLIAHAVVMAKDPKKFLEGMLD